MFSKPREAHCSGENMIAMKRGWAEGRERSVSDSTRRRLATAARDANSRPGKCTHLSPYSPHTYAEKAPDAQKRAVVVDETSAEGKDGAREQIGDERPLPPVAVT